ncbi:MAG TPA: dihydroorotate dehydrogenase-like protein [Elusimicrobia bacterium]|nr:dihydroorotate dehydrogenase-like protein [Elusimicrobiota bacterium]
MDLSTTFLGKKLRTPLIPSASPLSEELDSLKRMEDAGASAVVLQSVFEEQIVSDVDQMYADLERGSESFGEALTYFPRLRSVPMDPDAYLEHIRKAKAALKIPVFGSINGFSPGGWTRYARLVQEAGADGLELNTYFIPTELDVPGSEVEQRYLETVEAVLAAVTIPVSVKLSPFFSNLANFAARLDAAGVAGLALFNRFYQPDIDLETLEVRPHITLSRSDTLRLPLRWVAILHGRVRAPLGITGGVHAGPDALKAVLAGADAVFLCSTLLKHGIPRITEIESSMVEWLENKGYKSLAQVRGMLSQAKVRDRSAYERALYIETLTRTHDSPVAA